jgi:hypothetical protein
VQQRGIVDVGVEGHDHPLVAIDPHATRTGDLGSVADEPEGGVRASVAL